MVALDIRTLSFLTTSLEFLFSIGMLAFGLHQKRFRGFILLGTGMGLQAVGSLLLGYRDYLSDFITIVLANMLLIIGMAIIYEGVHRFVFKESKVHPVSIAAFVSGGVVFYYFTYPAPDVNARIIGIGLIIAVLSGFCAFDLIRDARDKDWQLSNRSTALIFVYFSLFNLFRVIWTSLESPIQSFMSAGTVHALSFISVIIFVAGSAFGFIWMVSKRLEQELIDLASLDPLTKVLNRRGVDNLAEREFAKLDRDLLQLVAVVMDIDNFKDINDSYGHTIGDEVLVSMAELLAKNLRPYDILGRLGGDEFILILPNTRMEKAVSIVERLRELIEKEVFYVNSGITPITASFGLAEATVSSNTLEQLLFLADKALYESKRKGNNQISVYSKK